MNDEEIRTMKDAVCALFAARKSVKPSDELIERFDNLYHCEKEKAKSEEKVIGYIEYNKRTEQVRIVEFDEYENGKKEW